MTHELALAEIIRTRLLGVHPDEQDVVLEDDDWCIILAALATPTALDLDTIDPIKLADSLGPYESHIERRENYSGEHRRWNEPFTLPKKCTLTRQIVSDAIAAIRAQGEEGKRT